MIKYWYNIVWQKYSRNEVTAKHWNNNNNSNDLPYTSRKNIHTSLLLLYAICMMCICLIFRREPPTCNYFTIAIRTPLLFQSPAPVSRKHCTNRNTISTLYILSFTLFLVHIFIWLWCCWWAVNIQHRHAVATLYIQYI